MKENTTTLCSIAEQIEQQGDKNKREYVIDLTADEKQLLSFFQLNVLLTKECKALRIKNLMEHGQHLKNCHHPECIHIRSEWNNDMFFERFVN